MNCTECQKSMHLYLDDELEPQQRIEIEVHLAGCGTCRCEAENWRGCFDTLRQTFPDQTVPSALWRKIQIDLKVPQYEESRDSIAADGQRGDNPLKAEE